MNDLSLSGFQVTIADLTDTAKVSDGESPFHVNQHSRRSGAVIDRIDDLAGIWDKVISRLSDLAAQSQSAATGSSFEMSEIEFNIGIEAGLSVGLVTKGEASVTIKFAKKEK